MTNRTHLTNDYSILSKYSSAKNGYFDDPLLIQLIESEIKDGNNQLCRRTPLINKGYSARQHAVEYVISQKLENELVDCIIILGAGFDTLSLRKRENVSDNKCHFIEIDLLPVIQRKRRFIREKINHFEDDIVTSPDGNVTSFKDLRLHLVSCDLKNRNNLIKELSQVFSHIALEQRRRVAVLNEVCLCYLTLITVKQIFRTLKELLSTFAKELHYVGFEQVKPFKESQFAMFMQRHFDKYAFPLKHFPTREQLKDLFLKHLKFNSFDIWPMHPTHHDVLSEHKFLTAKDDLRTCLKSEPFDEYEEMDIYLSHYALTTGFLNLAGDPSSDDRKLDGHLNDLKSHGLMSQPYDELCELVEETKTMKEDEFSCDVETEIRDEILRYGHSSCVLIDASHRKLALVSGGFGKYSDHNQVVTDRPFNPKSHRRLNDCVLLHWHTHGRSQALKLDLESSEPLFSLARMHGQVCRLTNNLVFFNGGRQNPQMGPQEVAPTNTSFVAQVNESVRKLSLANKIATNQSLRWRHKTLKVGSDQLIQVGGLRNCTGSGAPKESAIGYWNLSGDRCGFTPLELDRYQNQRLQRHSFGMDLRDEHTLLICGGLQSENVVPSWNDVSVRKEENVMLLDLRAPDDCILHYIEEQSYDCDIHFINEYQFFKIGGISTITGLPEDHIKLYDFRHINDGQPISWDPSPYVHDRDQAIFIPTKMTSVHFKENQEIITIGGGGNYFSFGTHFNNRHLKCKYDPYLINFQM